jgi:hypothetical protein
MNEGANPSPTIGMKIVNKARDGMVRNIEASASENSWAKTWRRVRTPIVIARIPAEIVTVTTYTKV